MPATKTTTRTWEVFVTPKCNKTIHVEAGYRQATIDDFHTGGQKHVGMPFWIYYPHLDWWKQTEIIREDLARIINSLCRCGWVFILDN